jgi:E3 ubiquitin-protein ligase NEDD4
MLRRSHDPIKLRLTLGEANGLVKRDIFSLPDPMAVVMVDSETVLTTAPSKRTLSPVWNHHFDLVANQGSTISIQIFDNRKFNRRDQGFLGVLNISTTDAFDLARNGRGMFCFSLCCYL